MKKILAVFFSAIFLITLSSCSNATSTWQFPIGLDDSKSKVQSVLGSSKGGMADNIPWYPSSGISVTYDNFEKVESIHFKGNYGYDDWITYESKIVENIDLSMNLSELSRKLGEPTRIDKTAEKYGWWIYFWKKDGFLVSAEIWIEDYEENGQKYPKNSIKILDIEKAI